MKRHRPDKPEEQLAIYDQLHLIPVQPPCDKCPWRKYPDKVQGCDNAGCGYMALYMAVKYQQRAFGYWPYKGQEVETAQMLIHNATDLLNRVDTSGEPWTAMFLKGLSDENLKDLLGAVSLIVDPLGQELLKKAAEKNNLKGRVKEA